MPSFIGRLIIYKYHSCIWEILHNAYTIPREKMLYGFKLCMSKAYDRVEWKFIVVVISKIGFPSKWIGLVMQCISTSPLSILLNGVPQNTFKRQTSLRQEWFLSPYLFYVQRLLVYNYLLPNNKKVLNWVHIVQWEVNTSHLFFYWYAFYFVKQIWLTREG